MNPESPITEADTNTNQVAVVEPGQTSTSTEHDHEGFASSHCIDSNDVQLRVDVDYLGRHDAGTVSVDTKVENHSILWQAHVSGNGVEEFLISGLPAQRLFVVLSRGNHIQEAQPITVSYSACENTPPPQLPEGKPVLMGGFAIGLLAIGSMVMRHRRQKA